MAKRLREAEEIKVKANVAGVPVSFIRKGRREQVAAIYDRWRINDEWWGEKVERNYFRIRTSSGLVCDIYHDTSADHWYLDRIHD